MMDEEEFMEMIIMNISDDDDNGDWSHDEQETDEEPVVTVNVEGSKRMGDPRFKSHFRMNRVLFQNLIVVGRHMAASGWIIRKGTGIDLSLMMTLWILATPDSFRSTGVKFGVSKGSVHNQYRTIIEVLREMRGSYIKWPSRWERHRISRIFEDLYGYPGVCGCIDCTHIRMTAPLEQAQRYFNWHRENSILVQAVCDHMLLFRDVFVGQPGSVGDQRSFQRSPLGSLILRRDDLICDDLHLLGVGAYVVTSKLLTPYRNNGNLTQRQRAHNYHPSQCRASIERAFALLKGKWRRLKYFQNFCIEYANDHIIACIVLHNFIILEGEQYDEDVYDDVVLVPAHITDQQLLDQCKAQGALKREYIATLIHPDP